MSIIKSFFSSRFKSNIKERLGVPSLHWSLQNLKKAGLTPNFAIDGGAYIGEWTKDFLEVFPDSKVLMIEAQSAKEPTLKSVCEKFSNVHYHMALMAAKDNQELSFVENETISYTSFNPLIQTKEKKLSTTLDSIIEMNNYQYPDFIKLDVQGYEIEVLRRVHLSV
ncbi:MAG: FkbM family methyltransferase [Ferruginibacter sp.]